MILADKRIVITGGTGSLGKTLVHRILSGELGTPKKVVIFSGMKPSSTTCGSPISQEGGHRRGDLPDYMNILEMRIGDIRDYANVCSVLKDADLVFNAGP